MPRSDLGKSENYYFLETTAALGLKCDRSIRLNKLMLWSEYQRSSSFFNPGQREEFKVKTCFSQKQLGDLESEIM